MTSSKNEEIYVQRAQRMYEAELMRTALFRWEMEAVDVIALADLCFHGYDKIVRNIQELSLVSTRSCHLSTVAILTRVNSEKIFLNF